MRMQLNLFAVLLLTLLATQGLVKAEEAVTTTDNSEDSSNLTKDSEVIANDPP